jgi:hypothetical protein
MKKAARLPARPLKLVISKLTDAAALHQIYDGEDYNRASKCDNQSSQRKILDAAAHAELVSDYISDNRTNAACDHIPHDTHGRITVHDLAGQPSSDAANDNCNNPTHEYSSSLFALYGVDVSVL